MLSEENSEFESNIQNTKRQETPPPKKTEGWSERLAASRTEHKSALVDVETWRMNAAGRHWQH